jgi:uroporphyrinogen-III synthase
LRAADVVAPAGMKTVSIGPVTSGTLRELGWEPAAEADPHDLAGLVAAVTNALAG